VTRPVHLRDLPRFRSAVLVNSITPGQPVVGIDNVPLEADPSLLAVLQRAYLAQPSAAGHMMGSIGVRRNG
jgi:hypothetical protein